MRQIHLIPLCISLLFLAAIPGCTDGFSLIAEENMILTLSVRIAFLSEIILPENTTGFTISDASLSLKGELYNALSFKLSLDADIPEEWVDEYTLLLKDVYIRYVFHDFVSLYIGQFKVPFGEEIFYGSGERPYIDKTTTSGKIPPGRDLGVMVSGKNIINLFGYDLGLFLGKEPDLPEDAEKNYLAAGKIFMQFKELAIVDILLGYNAYYHSYFWDVETEQFAQGFFFKAIFEFDKANTLTVLAEYQERVLTWNVINRNMDWRRGIFIITSYRYNFIEPYLLPGWYDGNLLDKDEDDLFLLTTGLTGYFLPKDLLRIKVLYELEYPYHSDVVSHKVSVLIQLEL